MNCLCTRCIIVNSVQVRSEFGKFAYTAICMRTCTLWPDNTCVFTRFHCVKNANTQLIWSSGTQPEIIYMSSFSRFVHCLACSSTEYIRISKVCFQYMNVGSLYFVSLAKTSCREMLMTLNAPVTTWSAELYMNGKLYRWNQGI